MGNNNRKLQKPSNPEKEKKAKTITIENTPLGTIELKNSAMNQVIKNLFGAARKGEFLYDGYLYSDIFDKLTKKGLTGFKKQKGNFPQQIEAVISWKKAFENFDETNLSKFPMDKHNIPQILQQFLPQMLYVTTCRALKELENNLGDDERIH